MMRPLTVRIRVVLPEPLRPRRAVVVFGFDLEGDAVSEDGVGRAAGTAGGRGKLTFD